MLSFSTSLLPKLAALSLSIRLATSTSLSDFTPRTENLSGQCADIYKAQIPGCTNDDFVPSPGCSSTCLAGLVQMNNNINANCRSAKVSDTSIIGLFLAGNGIQVLCNVAVVTTTTGSVTSTSMSSLGSAAAAASSSSASVSSGASSSSAAASSSTDSASSAADSATSSTARASSTRTKSSTTSASKSAKSTPTNTAAVDPELLKSGNVGSGGGSPFDVVINGGAAGGVGVSRTLPFTIVLLFGLLWR